MRALPITGILILTALAGCIGDADTDSVDTDGDADVVGYEPHVIIGVTDSGINPYHETYFRADRTGNPCEYIQGMPCDLIPLNLSVGPDHPWMQDDNLSDEERWHAAFDADRALWEGIEPEEWYYIPQTVFVAATAMLSADDLGCTSGYSEIDGTTDDGVAIDVCILDDTSAHGTGTTSSALSENPDAYIAFSENINGRETSNHFLDRGIPIDVFSMSFGPAAPMPLVGPVGESGVAYNCDRYDGSYAGYNPLYLHSAGNEPGTSSFLSCRSADPDIIQVGGAHATEDENTQAVLAYKEPDIVSYFCRPTADTRSINGSITNYCGTSFSAPTAAGAVSKVILALRQESGYLGGSTDGFIDPILGITPNDVRNAVNLTASYDPESKYDNDGAVCFNVQGNSVPCVPTSVPLHDEAPWLQWGWGFYDGIVADATIAHLLHGAEASKPDDAVQYQEQLHELRKALYS